MKNTIKNQDGCRASNYYGAWAIHNETFRPLFERARAIDLIELKKMNDAPNRQPVAAPALYEVDGGIAVISIRGPITKYSSSFANLFGMTSSLAVRRAVRAAVSDETVQAIMFAIDSPGGTVDGTADLCDEISAARAAGKECHAFVSGMAASAGYWIAASCGRITCGRTDMCGCIGTYAVLTDSTGEQDQRGVKYTVVSTGKYKGLGADGKVSADLVEDVQREIDDLNAAFIADVAKGRGMTPEQVSELADGRCHVGEKALGLGLVDYIGTFEAAMDTLRKCAAGEIVDDSPADAPNPPTGNPASAPDKSVEKATNPELSAMARFGATPAVRASAAAEIAKRHPTISAKEFHDCMDYVTSPKTPDDPADKSSEAPMTAEEQWEKFPAIRAAWKDRETFLAVRKREALQREQDEAQREDDGVYDPADVATAAGADWDSHPEIRAAWLDRETFVAYHKGQARNGNPYRKLASSAATPTTAKATAPVMSADESKAAAEWDANPDLHSAWLDKEMYVKARTGKLENGRGVRV